jgi:hypothetical protein
VSLLSAAENINSQAAHRPASLERVRTRYENVNEAEDPTLEPWAAVIAGTALTTAQSAIQGLR